MTPGDKVADRFVLVRQVGEGGMGAVFLATDQRTGGQVALKTLTLAGDAARARFEREALTLQSLQHPNTVGYVAHGLPQRLADRGRPMQSARIAVVGHVEHVCLGRVAALPAPGDIVHLEATRALAGGGGALAFAQLCRSSAEVHFFTAVGDDEAGREVEAWLGALGVGTTHVHVARRRAPHPRVVVLVDAEGRRTILVTSPPLQPSGDDALPWERLADLDAVYFTGSDPESLRLARRARRLVVTARRAACLSDAGVAADVVVVSATDPRENEPIHTYLPAPLALVLTDGPRAMVVSRAAAVAGGAPILSHVDPPPAVSRVRCDYGAGDSFAAALTFFVAHGLSVEEACRRAGPHGAAVLLGEEPLSAQLPLTLA